MPSHFGHVQLFATLLSVAHQAPLSMGFSRQEYWSGLPCPPPGDLPNPEMEPVLAGRFFTAEPPGKPILWVTNLYSLVSHKWACLVENHTRKVKDIHLSPMSGITVFCSCKLNPQLQLVVLSLSHTHTQTHTHTHTGPEEIQGEEYLSEGQQITQGLLGEPSPEPHCCIALTLCSPHSHLPRKVLLPSFPGCRLQNCLSDEITPKQDCKLVPSLPLTGWSEVAACGANLRKMLKPGFGSAGRTVILGECCL